MTDVAAWKPGTAEPEMSRRERLEQLRRQIAAVPARGEASVRRWSPSGHGHPGGRDAAEPADPRREDRDVLPVPGALAGLLPSRGLARGSVVALSGATSLLLGLVASVTAAGGHVAVIGHPRLGLAAAVEMGARLERLALIPDPGADPVEIAAVLLDGMDLVVLGLAGASVSPSRARAVVARARSKGATLLVTDGHWDGAEVRLDARVGGYRGVESVGADRSIGRLCSFRLAVQARGRSFQPRSTQFDIRWVRDRVEWVPDSDSGHVPVAPPIRVVGL
ncbi:hypothetical protein G4H71_17120 [Rhodococcus triatomae]|uniref:hypothetical protein n=1 Tax=Rhodococcus triatomae TaxID=300028 RepID=UPI000934F3CB|nr:hypothetical protein [Rhodococcus triatomae]QNG19553.1 hypothetical protein G4H72_13255 [Rhodococcus triatomae]QNG24532.1 hypothetical protein G4H71_17120 [Rhodococcus triatomae]